MPPWNRWTWVGLAAAFVQIVAVTAGSAGPVPLGVDGLPVHGAAAAGLYFDYLVILVMGNKNLCDLITTCGGIAPYLTSLSEAYGLADQDQFCNVDPSLPNYLCLTGASDFGCGGYSGDPNSNACTGTAWNASNIVDRLEAGGLTWKAYIEDMPTNCDAKSTGYYLVRHNPFLYYSDIATNASRCAKVTPAGTMATALVSDLASPTTASNYMWLTPNDCHNMHSCSIRTGDTFASMLVPQILDSVVFRTTRAALLVTFDEAYRFPAYTVWAGPRAKTNYVSSYGYTHFSVLATIESNWNLPPLTSNDGDAPHMGEFFLDQPSRGFHDPPPRPLRPIYVALISGAGGAAVIVAGVFLLRREKKQAAGREDR